MFGKEILCKSCDDKGFERLKLVKTGLRASISEIIYIKVWIEVLILALSIFVLTIFICLDRACFWIFFYKSAVFKINSNITPKYIIPYGEVLERSIFDRKSLIKLVLFSAFDK